METKAFGDLLVESGFDEFVGVPCSYLSPLINYAINEGRFLMANNEGDAVAIASGISLASKKYGVVLMQNSGLSNALSPLTSLNHTFKIPILGFVSLRGERDEAGNNTDEPQHELLGVITDKLLEVCEVEYAFLDRDLELACEQLVRAKGVLEQGRLFFFIVKKGVLESMPLHSSVEIKPRAKSPSLSPALSSSLTQDSASMPAHFRRYEVLGELSSLCEEMVLLATTGKSGRELYEVADRENQLYMVGSMGCVGALGLGIALKSWRKVVCIDGDGALLMRMGALSTNAYYAKQQNRGNFCHILLDNGVHDSTGGQFSLSPFVDFMEVARACGYERVHSVGSMEELGEVMRAFGSGESGGAWFVYIRIQAGSKENLGRPKIKPHEVAKRLRAYLNKE